MRRASFHPSLSLHKFVLSVALRVLSPCVVVSPALVALGRPSRPLPLARRCRHDALLRPLRSARSAPPCSTTLSGRFCPACGMHAERAGASEGVPQPWAAAAGWASPTHQHRSLCVGCFASHRNALDSEPVLDLRARLDVQFAILNCFSFVRSGFSSWREQLGSRCRVITLSESASSSRCDTFRTSAARRECLALRVTTSTRDSADSTCTRACAVCSEHDTREQDANCGRVHR